jgi:N-acetylmuramoyl-L-alanine amidase
VKVNGWLLGGVAATVVLILVVLIYPTPGSVSADRQSAAATSAPDVATSRAASTSDATTISPASAAAERTGPLDPARFSPGACIAFAPTSGNRHTTVFLDPGHGGPDPGAITTTATGQRIEEKQLTLPVALDTALDLRTHGYRVVLSRTTDTAVTHITNADLAGAAFSTTGKHADQLARIRCANLSGAAVLVSVHFDAFPADATVSGATTLYDTARPFTTANRALATALQHTLITTLATAGYPVRDRGIASDTTAAGGQITPAGETYGHLDILGPTAPGYLEHSTAMPGALIEPLFITNPSEAAIAQASPGQHAIATAINGAVSTYLTTSSQPTTDR